MKDPLAVAKKVQEIDNILIEASDTKDAAKKIVALFYGKLQMERKYFAVLLEASKKLEIEKNLLNKIFKNIFLSEMVTFNNKEFRYVRTFSELNKKQFNEFLNSVVNHLENDLELKINNKAT